MSIFITVLGIISTIISAVNLGVSILDEDWINIIEWCILICFIGLTLVYY